VREHGPVQEATDEDSRLLSGSRAEPALFGELYRRNRDPLLAWFTRRTLDAEVGADLAAETWAAVLVHRDRFDPRRGTAAAYIWGIANNKLKSWWRKGAVERRARERLGMPVLEVDDDAVSHVESLVDIGRIRKEVRQAVDDLPDGERMAVTLRILEGLEYVEVARRLRCEPGAARVRVSRGVARLRSRLQHMAESLEL
jgi:RNA polymerase sigma factor (sigma-70 family)